VIHFERSFDYSLIRDIITHPKLWPHLSDDLTPPASQFRPVESPLIWYVLPYYHRSSEEAPDLLGMWMFVPQTSICWEVHTALLPVAWGPLGQMAARLLPGWMWANSQCRRIVTNVPSPNRLALRFAIKAGMKIYGCNRQSYLKNGVLCDQLCLGLSKPDEWPSVGAETGLESIEEPICQ